MVKSLLHRFLFLSWLFLLILLQGLRFPQPTSQWSTIFHLHPYQSGIHKLCQGLEIKKYFHHNSKTLDFSLSFSYAQTVVFSREYMIGHLVTLLSGSKETDGKLNFHSISFSAFLNFVLCLLNHCKERR